MSAADAVARESIDLRRDSLSRLDGATLKELFEAFKAAIQSAQGQFTHDIAQRLDRLFTVKSVRMLRTSNAKREHLLELEDVIARIGREQFRESLEAYPERFHTRWFTLRTMLSTAIAMDEKTDDASRAAPREDKDWLLVADLVNQSRDQGVLTSDIAEAFAREGHGPQSKSAVSTLLGAMRAAGWLDAVAEGRRKRIFAGRNLPRAEGHAALANAAAAQRASAQSATPLHREISASRALERVREVVCLNQGKLIEFDHLAGLKHKAVKEALLNATQSYEYGTQSRKMVDLAAAVEDLDAYLEGSFRNAAEENFALFRRYFAARSDTAPRLCIKGNWKHSDDETGRMVSVIRDSDVQYRSSAPLEDNTGFRRVKDSGIWCLINNVPKAALRGTYKNPRFDERRLAKLRGQKAPDSPEAEAGLTQHEWERCWADYMPGADSRQFYRSTLVVPMTLLNNNLSADFLGTIQSSSAAASREHFDRTFVGFLCLDHVDVNFFDAEQDVHMAYVFADLMSVYLFKWLSLTRFSSAYRGAVAELGQANHAPPPVLSVQQYSLPRTTGSSLQLIESKHNYILTTPNLLAEGPHLGHLQEF